MQLPDRIVPATWAVQLNPPGSGTPGDTAATHTGSLSLNPNLPTNPGGYAYVEANSAADGASSGHLNGRRPRACSPSAGSPWYVHGMGEARVYASYNKA